MERKRCIKGYLGGRTQKTVRLAGYGGEEEEKVKDAFLALATGQIMGLIIIIENKGRFQRNKRI